MSARTKTRWPATLPLAHKSEKRMKFMATRKVRRVEKPLAGGWLSGRWRKGADDLTSRRAEMIPARYDLSIPANVAKLEAADAGERVVAIRGVGFRLETGA